MVHPSSSARNLGVMFNPSNGMEDHIKKICKSCHFHLTNIGEIRSYLDRESAIIHAFVTTNLDYCNAILNYLRAGSSHTKIKEGQMGCMPAGDCRGLCVMHRSCCIAGR